MLANKLEGFRLFRPFKVELTSAGVELVKLGFGITEFDAEVTEGLIKAAIEKRDGLFFVACSGNSVTFSGGVALKQNSL